MATELAHRNAHPKKGRHDQPAAIRDRVAAERMLDDLVRKAERGDAGIPDRESVPQPLGPLLDEFREVLGRKSGKQHVTEVVHNAAILGNAASRTGIGRGNASDSGSESLRG